MIKIIGFIIILASAAKLGYDLSCKYSNRTSELRSFINILERVSNEISFSNCIITDALVRGCNVRSKTISNMVRCVVDKVRNGNLSLTESFNSYMKTDDKLSLNSKDIDEIGRFFSILGSGDHENEIKNINNSIINIKSNLQSAIEDEKKYVKLFRTSGVLAGLLIAIILA